MAQNYMDTTSASADQGQNVKVKLSSAVNTGLLHKVLQEHFSLTDFQFLMHLPDILDMFCLSEKKEENVSFNMNQREQNLM